MIEKTNNWERPCPHWQVLKAKEGGRGMRWIPNSMTDSTDLNVSKLRRQWRTERGLVYFYQSIRVTESDLVAEQQQG